MRYVKITDGKVENIVVANPTWASENGYIECPDDVQIGYSHNGTVFAPPPTPVANLLGEKTSLANHIDDTIASILGRFTRFQSEYVEREAAAQTFVDAEYEGDPGIWITSFAGPAGITNNQAANLILSQAANLRTALRALGAARMAKYNILNAQDFNAAHQAHSNIMAQISVIAASL